MNRPPMDPNNPLLNKNPLDLKYIHSHQMKDLNLQQTLNNEDKKFVQLQVQGVPLIHFKNDENSPPKIVVPHAIQYAAIRWMHSLLGHVGISRLPATLRKHFWFPHMIKAITQFVQKYEFCQRYNKQTGKYGHVPQK